MALISRFATTDMNVARRRRFRRLSPILVAVAVLAIAGCSSDDSWSTEYRAEANSQCVNASSKVVGYAVSSWCACILDWREEHRTESEDRAARFGQFTSIDTRIRDACRATEPPELSVILDQQPSS